MNPQSCFRLLFAAALADDVLHELEREALVKAAVRLGLDAATLDGLVREGMQPERQLALAGEGALQQLAWAVGALEAETRLTSQERRMLHEAGSLLGMSAHESDELLGAICTRDPGGTPARVSWRTWCCPACSQGFGLMDGLRAIECPHCGEPLRLTERDTLEPLPERKALRGRLRGVLEARAQLERLRSQRATLAAGADTEQAERAQQVAALRWRYLLGAGITGLLLLGLAVWWQLPWMCLAVGPLALAVVLGPRQAIRSLVNEPLEDGGGLDEQIEQVKRDLRRHLED